MRQFFSSWTTKDYMTAGVALYGALLSTYMAWTKWRDTRARIRVTIQLAIATVPPMFAGFAIRIGGENHGFTDVHFDSFSASIQVKGMDKTFVIHKPAGDLPRALKHGESLTVLADLNALNDEIRKLKGTGTFRVRGVLRDQIDRLHKSKWNTMEVK